MTPPLEDHLHRLADDLAAPATPEARAAVRRRVGVLRRRRRARTAVGGGVVAVALVAGVAALQRDDPADVEMGPAGPDAAALPAFTVDREGWEVIEAVDLGVDEDVEDLAAPVQADPAEDAAAPEGSLQVFRRPGQLTGPSAFLSHGPASDAVVPEEGDETVSLNGADGFLRPAGFDAYSLLWNPAGSDSHAVLRTYGLSSDEVEAFAAGLRAKDDAISYPPAADDVFGFEASELPAGIEEDPVASPPAGPPAGRRTVLERDRARVEVTIDNLGDRSFESRLAELLTTAEGVSEGRVLDRTVVVVERVGDGGTQWNLTWQDARGAVVDVLITGVDAASVPGVAEDIRELRADAWRALVAESG